MKTNTLIYSVSLALSAGLLSISPINATAADASGGSEQLRLGVGIDPSYAAVYYADQNKLFQKAGLNVQLQYVSFGADALDAVIAGQNQLAGAAEYAVLSRAARGDIKGFVVFGQSPTLIKLVVRKGITKPDQIKTFGIVPGSAGEFVSYKLLTKYKIDPKTIKWVKGNPPEFPALLARGDIDAYFLWDPWPARGVAAGGTILMNSGDVGYSYNMLMATSGNWLQHHPEDAHKIAAVLNEACADIRKDPEKAVAATRVATKMPADQAREILKQIDCTVRDFTPEDLSNYRDIAQFQYAHKDVVKQVDVDAVMKSGHAAGPK